MKNYLRFGYLLILLLVFSACSTTSLLPTQSPQAIHTERYQKDTKNGVTIYFEHISQERDHMVFDIEIVNNSNKSIQYRPERLFYKTFTESNESQANESISRIIYADDYLKAKKRLKSDITNKKIGKTFFDIVSIGLLAVFSEANGANFYREGGSSVASDVTNAVLFAGTALISDKMSHTMAREINKNYDRLDHLNLDYLPQRIIGPGESARGLVYFEKQNNNQYLFIIPVDELEFQFELDKFTEYK